jgi:hypothetical protein
MDVGLTTPYVRQPQQLEAEAVFAGLRITFAAASSLRGWRNPA